MLRDARQCHPGHRFTFVAKGGNAQVVVTRRIEGPFVPVEVVTSDNPYYDPGERFLVNVDLLTEDS